MNKGLEALENIQVYRNHLRGFGTYFENNCEIIEDELKEKEKQDKALEIIKNRKVDIYLLEITKNVDQYNKPFCEHLVSLCRLLTQEEYDLLKEVLS